MRFVAKNKNPRILRQFFPPGGSGGAAPPSPASTLTARGAGGSPTAAAAATATTSGRRGSARGSVKAEERGAAKYLFFVQKRTVKSTLQNILTGLANHWTWSWRASWMRRRRRRKKWKTSAILKSKEVPASPLKRPGDTTPPLEGELLFPHN